MTLAGSTVWEVRTTGNAQNGGGFNASRSPEYGVDYSQQDTPDATASDVVYTGNQLNSFSNPFKQSHLGNIVYLWDGGVYEGFYEIVQYNGPGEVLIDDSCGAGGGASMRIGGAQSGLNAVLNAAVADSSAGNVIHVKAGTYVASPSYFDCAYAGHYRHPIVVRGYNSTRGDATVPCVVLDGNDGDWNVLVPNTDYWRFEYLEIWGRDPAAGTPTYAKPGVGIIGDHVTLYRCRVRNVGRDGIWASGNGALLLECEVSGWGCVYVNGSLGVRFLSASAGSLAVGVYVHDSSKAFTNHGFNVSAGGGTGFDYSIAARCSGHGFLADYTAVTGTVPLRHIGSHGNSGSGVYIDAGDGAGPHAVLLQNAIITGNLGYGVGCDGVYGGRVMVNGAALRDNSSGAFDSNLTVEEFVPYIVPGSSPYADPDGDDFRLSPDVAGCIGGGRPAAYLVDGALATLPSYPDLGAVQDYPGWRRPRARYSHA